jgi:hypothetical protein
LFIRWFYSLHPFSQLKSKNADRLDISTFVVVNLTTIVTFDYRAMLLLRLSFENETFEQIKLVHQPHPWAAYAITAIEGAHVDVKHTVLNCEYSSHVRFVRLNLDGARLEGEVSIRTENRYSYYQLSSDGRFLYGLSHWSDQLNTLHCLDIEKRTWGKIKLAGDLGKVRASST